MKHNPWSLARPQWEPVTQSFTDPRHPGVEFTLTVRPLDACELLLALEKAEELTAKWVTGANGQPPLDYPLGGGQVKLSASLLRLAAILDAQQCGTDGESTPLNPDNYYNLDDLIGLAHMAPAAWSQVSRWANGLVNAVEEPAGNE